MSVIYWFSGTGNSLYAAKRLSESLGGVASRAIASGAPDKPVGGEFEKVGFVFPSYYGNLPRAVRAFVECLDVRPGTYIFAVVTMGGPGGGAVASLKAALEAKGLRLGYGVGVRMPANYVMMYNPASVSKSAGKLAYVDKKLEKAAREISARVQRVRTFPVTSGNLYKNVEKLDRQFSVDETCVSCGQCAKICPAANIRLEGGGPKWRGRCEHCAACISWCPSAAIQYGAKTRGRRRYHNPAIKAAELFRTGKI
ncbi:MAG: EFR1 family ferrodoxin [Clostridiales bacterium]|jgi:ferredoxin|nr:EFR1 family ferrodoxin [Clostridiales bacterium]